MAKQAKNDADGMLAAILEGLKPALKSAFENFSFVGEAGADEPKKKYGGVKNKEAKDVEGKYGGIKNAGPDTPGTGKGVTDAVMDRAREDPELDKLYEDRFKDATPTVESETVGGAASSATKDPGEGAMAAAGRLLNPVGAESRGAAADPAFFIGERAAGQRVDKGGVHGGTIGAKPAESDTQTVAMQDTIADLQARLAKMELGGGTTPAAPAPAPATPAAPAPAPTAAETATIGDEFLKQAAPTGAGPPPPLSVQSSALRPGIGWHSGEEGVPTAQLGDAGREAIDAGNQQDVANGGGNRGLMAAIGGAFSGAKGAVGGALGGAKDAVGGALSNVAGGPRPPLKAQYKDLSNNELARLERQGIDIYEAPETDQFAQSFKGG